MTPSWFLDFYPIWSPMGRTVDNLLIFLAWHFVNVEHEFHHLSLKESSWLAPGNLHFHSILHFGDGFFVSKASLPLSWLYFRYNFSDIHDLPSSCLQQLCSVSRQQAQIAIEAETLLPLLIRNSYFGGSLFGVKSDHAPSLFLVLWPGITSGDTWRIRFRVRDWTGVGDM